MRKISVRQFLFTQDGERVLDEEAGGIEHDQYFGKQRLDVGLAGLLRDAARDVGFGSEKILLETAQDLNAIANAPGIPAGLCGASASGRGTNFGWSGTVQLAQNFARGRVHRSETGNGNLNVGGH